MGQGNACLWDHRWVNVNYLSICDASAENGDLFGEDVAAGIRCVIRGETPLFHFEYPCHSPNEKRWFMMSVTPFQQQGLDYFVISHQNITERKLAEIKSANLAITDGLTGISNRLKFNEFLQNEWRRCLRHQLPISLALVDVDHFKMVNDTFGHIQGDSCLIQIAHALRGFVKRPGDLASRYGGEEFTLIWGGLALESASQLAQKICHDVEALGIPNPKASTKPVVTVSIGLVSVIPMAGMDEFEFVNRADENLYQAKASGRNQTCWLDSGD